MAYSNPISDSSLSSLQIFCFTILGLISFLSGFFLLWAYMKLRKIRQVPGVLILSICVCLTLLAFYDGYSGLYFVFQEQVLNSTIQDTQTCSLHGLVTVYITILYWNYTLCLSIQVVLLCRKRGSRNFLVYHISSNVLSLVLTGVLYATGGTGISFISTCYTNQKSWGVYVNVLFLVYLPVYLFSALFLIGKSFVTTKKWAVYLWIAGYIILISLFSLPQVVSLLFLQESNNWVVKTAVVFKSVQCLVVCLLRICQGQMRTYLKCCKQRNTQIVRPLLHQEAKHTVNDSMFSPRGSMLTAMEIDQQKVNLTLLSLYIIFSQREAQLSQSLFEEMLNRGSFFEQQRTWNLRKQDFLPVNEELANKATFQSCTVIQHAPIVFSELRHHDGWCNNDIYQSLNPNIERQKSSAHIFTFPGDSLVFYTHDKKFIIKEINPADRQHLVSDFIPRYNSHLSTTANKSLLSRLLGIFTIETNQKYDVAIIENIISDSIQNPILFELKGRRLDRQVLSDPSINSIDQLQWNVIHKDLDFMQTQKFLYMSLHQFLWLKRIIEADLEFLKDLKALHYSLFIAIGKASSVNLPPRYLRHTYKGRGQDEEKVYVLGIFNHFKEPKKSSRIQRMNSYEDIAGQFSSLLTSIVKCHSL